MLYFCPLERWQSGRLRRSWKPLSCEAPGVRIPPSPQDYEAKRYREIDTFCFYTFGASSLADEGVKTKDGGVPLFAQWACKGPCGEQKGKALSGANEVSVVANPSLSAGFEKRQMIFGSSVFFLSNLLLWEWGACCAPNWSACLSRGAQVVRGA